MLFRTIAFIALFSIAFASEAQQYIRATTTPHVVVNGTSLRNPWAGGFNSPQWNELDVDFDGLMDLFIYDRVGDRFMVFRNTGTEYIFTTDFNEAFPTGLKNWVVMRDFNCDGKMDFATSSQSGFVIYNNTGNATDGLSFEILTTPNFNNLQLAEFNLSGSPFTAPAFVFSIDIPSFIDHDGDGDIDLFSFTELSSTVYYFKNMSVEEGNCSIPRFECVNRCYGYFSESVESFDIFIGAAAECSFNVQNPRALEGERLHAGGTLLSIDLDGNGIHDLIMSDVTESNMAAFMMQTSTEERDSVVTVDYTFPANFTSTQPGIVDVFPAGYYLDLNHDGIKDLVMSPNTSAESSDRFSATFYANFGQNNLPNFSYQGNTFLQSSMIDFGTGAFPAFEDLNGDGLLDLIVANRKYYEPGNLITSKLHYFKNIGTSEEPQFELINDNYLDIPSFGWRNVYPSFGDVDGDGDRDLLLGDNDGFLHLFINTSAGGGEAVFVAQTTALADNTGTLIDVGQSAAPCLVDMNDDGLLDLLIGERSGNLNLYINIGNASEPIFELFSNTFGNVSATNILGIDGYSTPIARKNDFGVWEVFIGSETGQINHYEITDNNLNGDFLLLNETYAGINEGVRCAIAMADITGDGVDDLAYGHIGGGVALFVTEEIPETVEEFAMDSFTIFPNPSSQGELNIKMNTNAADKNLLQVYDTMGRTVYSQEFYQNRMNIRLSLERGIYFVNVNGKTQKWIVR